MVKIIARLELEKFFQLIWGKTTEKIV